MITVENCYKNYGSLDVLKNINLTIQKGDIVFLTGSSGAGKTTLLHIMGLLDKPSSGEVYYFGNNIKTMNAAQINVLRNQKIGFVFQFHHLFQEFSVLENMSIPAWINPHNNPQKMTAWAFELLDFLGLSDKAHRKPKELSGGEQQRVAIARALMNKPDIVFADEPTGNLDSTNTNHIQNLIIQLNKTFQQTFLIVTHNLDFAQSGHRMITMKDGSLFAEQKQDTIGIR